MLHLSLLVMGENWTSPGGDGHLGPAFSAALEAEDQASDAPLARRAPPGLSPGSSRRAKDRFPRSCVNKSGFPGPGAPFIDKCVAHIRRHRPPPIPQLCRRGPASGARSPLRCSRTKGLDPPRLRGLFARGREDRAPLSTSAIKTIVEHNRLIDRTPLTAPRVAPKRSSWPADRDGFRRPDQPAGRVANAPFEARPAEISRARGKRWVLIQPLLLSTRSLALRAYPQPDRLRHLLSRARLGAGMENPTPRRSSIKRMLRRAAWQNPLSRFSP